MLNWIYTLLRIIPSKIKIKRIEDYHTHYLGKCSGDKLFWGYATYSLTQEGRKKNDYAILHLFDKKGNYLDTKWSIRKTPTETDLIIKEFLESIQPIKYGDIKIKLFETKIDELTFGLISDKKFRTIDLEPNSTISFTPPWLGYYDT